MTNKTIDDEPWETQAASHEGHLRTVVAQGETYKTIKCSCGHSFVEGDPLANAEEV